MAAVSDRPANRHWADLLAILAGVSLVAFSLWPSITTTSPEGDRQTGSPGTLIVLRILVGLVAIAAVGLAQREQRRGLARSLLISGAVVLLVALVAVFRDFSTWETWSLALPAVAMLVAASGVGPMPVRVDHD